MCYIQVDRKLEGNKHPSAAQVDLAKQVEQATKQGKWVKLAAEMKESTDGRVPIVVEQVELPVEMVVEGCQVDLVGEVGLMVATEQVVPDDQVDSEKDQRVVLVAQYLGHTEHVVVFEVQQVVLVMDKFSPWDQKRILIDLEVDPRDQRVVHVGTKAVLVKVGLVDRMVVPVDQKQGLAELKVVPMRVVLVNQRVAQVEYISDE